MSERIEELLKQAEERLLERYYPHEKEKLYIEAARLAEESGDGEKLREIVWEIDLINRVIGRVTDSGIKEISDKWGWALSNVGVALDNEPFCKWDKNGVAYYKRRFHETANLLQRARYGYAIWTLEKSDAGYSHGVESANSFLETAKLYIEKKWYSQAYRMVPLCFGLALRIFVRLNLDEDLVSSVNQLDEAIQAELADGERRWVLDLFDIEAQLSETLRGKPGVKDDARIHRILSAHATKLRELSQSYFREENYHLGRFPLRMLIPLLSYLGKREDIPDTRVRIAESFEEEAKSRKEALIARGFYETAVKLYGQARDEFTIPSNRNAIHRKIEELKSKIKEMDKQATYGVITAKVRMPEDEIRNEISRLKSKSSKEIIEELISPGRFVPDLAEVKNFVRRLKSEYPVQFIFPISVVRHGITIRKYASEEEIFAYKTKDQFMIESKIYEVLLTRIFKELKADKLSEASLLEFLESNRRHLEDDVLAVIKHGLSRHFAGDYISCLHILVPQLEAITRRILEDHGISPIKVTGDEYEFSQLRRLLEHEKTNEILGSNFVTYMKLKLIDTDMENLRNEICHGLLEYQTMNERNSVAVLYMILRLCACR